jgi:3-isopropylmalate dehydrogenase
MMFRFSFGWTTEADAIEAAVAHALDDGFRTADIYAGEGTQVSTHEMAKVIAERIT